MHNIAVILSGCGYLDGAEIREAVITLLELDKNGCDVKAFAPNTNQMHVVDHLTGEETQGQSRNVLIESARIMRGNVEPLENLDANNFDALVLPGGFGVAKNLSDLAIKGSDAEVLPEFKNAILQFVDLKKPIGAICISPAVLAAAVKGKINANLTIGDDSDGLINSLNSTHVTCPTQEICTDEKNKIVSCSAYMREDSIANVAQGIEKLVKKLLQLI